MMRGGGWFLCFSLVCGLFVCHGLFAVLFLLVSLVGCYYEYFWTASILLQSTLFIPTLDIRTISLY